MRQLNFFLEFYFSRSLYFPSISGACPLPNITSLHQSSAGADLGGGCRGCAPPPPEIKFRIYVFTFKNFLAHCQWRHSLEVHPSWEKSWIRPCSAMMLTDADTWLINVRSACDHRRLFGCLRVLKQGFWKNGPCFSTETLWDISAYHLLFYVHSPSGLTTKVRIESL